MGRRDLALMGSFSSLCLLALIHNWHHQGSSTPSSCTTSSAHQGRLQCSTSVSEQTPLLTSCEEGWKLPLRPRDRAIKEEHWKSSNQLCMLQIKYTQFITQTLFLWNTSKDEKRSNEGKCPASGSYKNTQEL